MIIFKILKKKKKEKVVSNMVKKVYWMSRHPPLPSQIKRLEEIYEENVEIIQDPKPFDNAEDIVERFKSSGADDIVVVAPLTVLQRLTELGVKPLYAKMELVDKEKAEVEVNGRYYRFVDFQRVHGVNIYFEPVKPVMKTKLLTVRIPQKLFDEVKEKAAREETSVSEIVRHLLRLWLKGKV